MMLTRISFVTMAQTAPIVLRIQKRTKQMNHVPFVDILGGAVSSGFGVLCTGRTPEERRRKTALKV
jgi:hypothetical protein